MVEAGSPPFMKASRTLLIALLVAIPTTAIYATRLDFAPIYLMHDEVNFSLQAISVARTGRDLNGRLLPLYFSEPAFVAGRDPMMIYATAAAVSVMPVSEFAVRLPTALVGILTVLLTLLAAAWIFESTLEGGTKVPPYIMGVVAASMLALTPAMFIHSRLALTVIYPLPFVIGWLACLRRFNAGRGFSPTEKRLIFAAGLLLGLAVYAYLAALVMLPVYISLTIWFLWSRGSLRYSSWLFLGVAAALIPLLLWQVAYPDRYYELIRSYRLGAASEGANAIPALISLEGLRFRLHQWWLYFDPAYLFISGDTSMTNSTRSAGCFPLAFAVLIPIGVHRLWTRGSFGRLLIAGFATAPLAAIMTGTVDLNRYRALFILPFGALLAAAGFERLWQSPWRRSRWVAAALLITIAAQFWFFYRDYMGGYRESASTWFGRNLKGAYVEILGRGNQQDPVMLSANIPFAGAYWRFYAQMFRPHLEITTPVIAGGEAPIPKDASPGSWLVAAPNEPWLAGLSTDGWQPVKNIFEPSGTISFVVYRKMPAQ